MKQDAAILADRLTRRFSKNVALEDVTFAIPRGAVTLLTGANGAGKSTLLRLLIDLDRPTKGNASVLGFDPTQNGSSIRSDLGYIAETDRWGYPMLTVEEIFEFVRRDRANWNASYADNLCNALGVQRNRRLGTLSKGQRRAVQIVAALAYDPALLILDEMTDGLDPVARSTVLSLVADHIARTECTTILSTHLVAEVESLADYVIVLSNGRLKLESYVSDLLRRAHRLEIDAPDNWTCPKTLTPWVQTRGWGRLVETVHFGDLDTIRSELTSSGADLRHAHPLSLAESVVAMLKSESCQ